MMNHNELPKVTEGFDRRVQETLQNLPAHPQRTRRLSFKTIAAIGAAAALCLGGTAFAASDLPQQLSAQFQLLFQRPDAQRLDNYTVTPAPGELIDETEDYRVSVESVLFDESAGAGVISLHLENKKGDGVMPFSTAHTLEQFKGDNIAWSNLIECTADKDGQLMFDVWFGQADWCAGKFYLDETRSTPNDYYIEGAFIPAGPYTGTEGALRLEVSKLGEYITDENGMTRAAPILTVTLPDLKPMPYYRSESGLVTLSPIGLRVRDPEMNTVVDDLNAISIQMKDGSVLVVLDKENNIDRTLYALGHNSDPSHEGYDTGSYVLAKTFALENVRSVVLNGVDYPLS